MAAAGETGQWRTGGGFILAALGSAVGLGNVWRFSYVAGENGGGAFVAAYLVAVLAFGLPLLIAEVAIGRGSPSDPVAAFARIAPRRPWRWTGWLGVAACVAILGYYPTISGWVANYLWRYAAQGGLATGAADYATWFRAVLADPVQAVFWPAATLAIAGGIVALGVARGIERASKVLMPLFVLLLVALLIARCGWRRPWAAAVATAAMFALGLPAALGFGVLAPYLPGPAPFLDRLDLLASDILLPLSGIAIALTAGWQWRRADSLRATGIAPGLGATLWLWSLRVGLPVAIGLAMARGLGLL
jgi:NSS family neurotransmitter:Na+ symporter